METRAAKRKRNRASGVMHGRGDGEAEEKEGKNSTYQRIPEKKRKKRRIKKSNWNSEFLIFVRLYPSEFRLIRFYNRVSACAFFRCFFRIPFF